MPELLNQPGAVRGNMIVRYIRENEAYCIFYIRFKGEEEGEYIYRSRGTSEEDVKNEFI
jgi:hypothetical protein